MYEKEFLSEIREKTRETKQIEAKYLKTTTKDANERRFDKETKNIDELFKEERDEEINLIEKQRQFSKAFTRNLAQKLNKKKEQHERLAYQQHMNMS